MLPSVAFSADVDHYDDKHQGNYDIRSKPSSSKPSMMQIWSGDEGLSARRSHLSR